MTAAAAAAGAARDDDVADQGPVFDSPRPSSRSQTAPAGRYDPAYDAQYYDDEAGAYPYEYDNWEERASTLFRGAQAPSRSSASWHWASSPSSAERCWPASSHEDPGGVAQEVADAVEVAASPGHRRRAEAPSAAPSAGGSAESQAPARKAATHR